MSKTLRYKIEACGSGAELGHVEIQDDQPIDELFVLVAKELELPVIPVWQVRLFVGGDFENELTEDSELPPTDQPLVRSVRNVFQDLADIPTYVSTWIDTQDPFIEDDTGHVRVSPEMPIFLSSIWIKESTLIRKMIFTGPVRMAFQLGRGGPSICTTSVEYGPDKYMIDFKDGIQFNEFFVLSLEGREIGTEEIHMGYELVLVPKDGHLCVYDQVHNTGVFPDHHLRMLPKVVPHVES